MRTRRSLLDLDDLSAEELRYIFERTQEFEANTPGKLLDGIPFVNMFFEPSTRTYTSFSIAEKRLGTLTVDLTDTDSSMTKGETIEDTVVTLCAMGILGIVVRHSEPGFPARIATAFDGHVINAGDGAHAHPTQALLDIHTLREEFGTLEGRTVAIVGDVLHSRVAHSSIHGLRRLGAHVVLVGPEVFLPSEYRAKDVSVERDLDSVLPQIDAVMLLRIQRERFAAMPMTDGEYIEGYQLNGKRLAKLRKDAIVMHPGPYNRGMELDETVLEFTGWRYAKQVMHGVYVRMAVLDFLVNGIKRKAHAHA